MENHKEWIDLYWKAWEIAYNKIRYGTPENGFAESYVDEGFNPNIFQWDTNFMIMFLKYGIKIFPVEYSLDNFYHKQHKDGFICREIREKDGSDYWKKTSRNAINPPIFSWAEWELYKTTGNKGRLKTVLPYLVKYFDWIKTHRRFKNGLYWSTGWASGMDNSPRTGTNVHHHNNYSWIDISAQQALNARHITMIANEVDRQDIVKRFNKEYLNLSKLINMKMWDSKTGMYYDLDAAGKISKVKTLASFWPLLAKITDDKQSELLRLHLINDKEFFRKHVFATLSADHPKFSKYGDYWRGSVWAPTNYMCIKGLEIHSYEKEAFIAAENHIQNMTAVYKNSKTIWENYAPDTISPGNDSRPDFVGWSGCGPIALLIENILGFRAFAPTDSLYWNLTLIEQHGIKNLRFGDIITSLLAEKREYPELGCNIIVESNKDYLLSIYIFDTLFRKSVKKGRNKFHLVLE